MALPVFVPLLTAGRYHCRLRAWLLRPRDTAEVRRRGAHTRQHPLPGMATRLATMPYTFRHSPASIPGILWHTSLGRKPALLYTAIHCYTYHSPAVTTVDSATTPTPFPHTAHTDLTHVCPSLPLTAGYLFTHTATTFDIPHSMLFRFVLDLPLASALLIPAPTCCLALPRGTAPQLLPKHCAT